MHRANILKKREKKRGADTEGMVKLNILPLQFNKKARYLRNNFMTYVHD